MFCRKCGNEIPDGASFCNACGERIALSAPPEEEVRKPPQASRKKPQPALVAGGVAVAAVAVVAVVGLFTNWFGLASNGNELYVVKSSVSYARNDATADGYDITAKNTYEIDEHGNRAMTETESYENGQITSRGRNEYTLDANGFPVENLSFVWMGEDRDDAKSKNVIENEYDNDGRVVRIGPAGSDEEYSYYGSGQLKSTAFHVSGDIEVNQLTTYDESGYAKTLAYEYESSHSDAPLTGVKSSSFEFAWQFDSSNRPISYKVTTTTVSVDADGKETTAVTEKDFEVCVDSHGNIVEISAKDGSTRTEFEYARIDNPSLAARSKWAMPFRLQ